EAKRFVEDNGLAPLHARVEDARLARACVDVALDAVEAALKDYNAKADMPLGLKSVPAPRYWRPTDPVILIAGNAAKPTARFAEAGDLECKLLSIRGNTPDLYPEIRDLVDQIYHATGSEQYICRQQPWHPYLLEWQVDVHPLQGIEGSDASYDDL